MHKITLGYTVNLSIKWKANCSYFNYTKGSQQLRKQTTDLGHAGMSSGSLQNGSWYLQ